MRKLYIVNNDLAYWLNACDLIVFPGLRELIIIYKDYGLLCEPLNSQQLANNIIVALNKDWDEIKMMKYTESFSLHTIACKLLDVYNKIV